MKKILLRIFLLALLITTSPFESHAYEIVSEKSWVTPGCEGWVVHGEIVSRFLPSTTEPIPLDSEYAEDSEFSEFIETDTEFVESMDSEHNPEPDFQTPEMYLKAGLKVSIPGCASCAGAATYS